ncbi:thiamine pyrophosphate-dependent enzyme [Bradyrhizobium ontarionense]|uniref:Thiamine pyrophosphate-dependent enzyme n=1 Tax=Bradyrhizobium ontarionense TaxID=2898149 RepID=A0ABY3R606_9BRAD|nr:thiamine pyrophosphate-binding protein [Bradyrhizobium sp. A19]UFZ02755.1 thiamine pyrophosphate-dependent enzyme [Bradyrhizobium sp. A19]
MNSGVAQVGKVNARRGAEVLLEVLESEGVRYIFGNPGTTELPLMDALVRTPDIHYVLGLQEASVVAMADGYAQAARRPAFLNLHTAGGLGHGMGNLLNASVSQTPLVVSAGQQDSRHTISDPLLFGDLVRIAEPAVKWAREIASADQLPVLVRRAFHDANAAPSGPVFLSFPMDVMEEMSTIGISGTSNIDRSFTAGSLGLLASHLAEIRPGRLAIIAGDEIYTSQAASEVVALAEILGAPVYGSSWPSRIPYPTSHPLWSGNLPTMARSIAEILSDYDAIFALGGKSLITILYTEGSAVPPGCDVFQLSSDVRDLGRTYTTRLSVMGEIKASLQVLLPVLREATKANAGAYSKLVANLAGRRQVQRAKLASIADAGLAQASVSPLVAAREAVRAIGPDVAIVDEAIATSAHVRRFLDSASPNQYSFLRGGGLGWGMPAAVGCSLGLDRAPVVSLVGDGAALYSPQAMWTAAHEKLPVTFVVMNNREYNVLKNFMKSQTHYLSAQANSYLAMEIDNPAVDYLALARSMGLPAKRVDRPADVAAAIEAGIASGVPNLIEVIITAD